VTDWTGRPSGSQILHKFDKSETNRTHAISSLVGIFTNQFSMLAKEPDSDTNETPGFGR